MQQANPLVPQNFSYLPSASLDEYLREVASLHPQLQSMLDFDRPGASQALDILYRTKTEFDSDSTGRGDSYRQAQIDSSVRWTGMKQLLELAGAGRNSENVTVLDVLGGDGTVSKAVERHTGELTTKINILTSDLSGEMVAVALEQGLPAVRQSADFLFMHDNVVDATVLAYGTHHISAADRVKAISEAVRVTAPGGRVIVHDFDELSPMALFFSQVVHSHSTAGHAYAHFSREELTELFQGLPVALNIIDFYDPFKVRATSPEDARARMCDYVSDMYGIGSLIDNLAGPDEAWDLLVRCFDHTGYSSSLSDDHGGTKRPIVYKSDDQFVAEVPRVAIVAVAEIEG